MRSTIFRLIVFFVLPISTILGFQGRGISSSLPTQTVDIDPIVWDQTSRDRWTSFLIIMKDQADVKTATLHVDACESRVKTVFDLLQETARLSQKEILKDFQHQGIVYRSYWIINALAVQGNRQTLESLATNEKIQAIRSNQPFRVPLENQISPIDGPNIVTNSDLWNLRQVKALDLWSFGIQGEGIVYANADTGVNWSHPALKNQYRGWDGNSVDHNFHWWDAIHEDLNGVLANPCGYGSPIPCDDSGHGTHVMGTGVGDDGDTNQIGVAPRAKWIACRNMDDGWGQPSTYIECLQFFLAPTDLNGKNPDPDKHAHVISNSYTCPPYEGCDIDSLQLAVENLRAAGIFMAVSAGNSGPGCSSVKHPPALYDAATTVGAVDSQNSIAGFSSRGPVTIDESGRLKPDLVAPGVNIMSSSGSDGYSYASGTSMAAPHVAGAAALLESAFPTFLCNVERIELALTKTALPLTNQVVCGENSLKEVPNNVFGYGLVNVQAAYIDLALEVYSYHYLYPMVFNTLE